MTVEIKLPLWLRLFNIGFGLLSAFLAFYIVLNFELAFATLLVFFILVLLFSGFVRVMNGLFNKAEGNGLRILNVIFGILIFLLGFYILTIDPIFGVELIVLILAFALLITGSARIVIGLVDKLYPLWARLILFFIGAISVILAFYVFVSPALGLELLVLTLALGFLFNGIGRIITGLTGWLEYS